MKRFASGSMEWHIYDVEEKGKMIVKVRDTPKKNCNPFEYYFNKSKVKPYIQFISIDENKDQEILDFIEGFGFLGLIDKDKDNDHIEYIKLHGNIACTIEGISDPIDHEILTQSKAAEDSQRFELYGSNIDHQMEGIDEIRKEITKFKNIILLLEAIEEENSTDLVSNISDFFDIRIDNNLDFGSIEIHTLVHIAKVLITFEVNKNIMNSVPVLEISKKEQYLQGNWITPNLLSAMYLMLYMDLTNGSVIRKCRSETCSKYFEIVNNDLRKIYCSEGCARAEVQRQYRRRKKGGKSNGR